MAADKQAKSAVGYRAGGDHCGVCRHFRESAASETGRCELVAGAIDEDMVCRLFERRRTTIAHGGERG